MTATGTPPVRLGVLGRAAIARRRLLPAAAAHPGVVVTAIASRAADLTGLAAGVGAAAVVGYERLLERTDIDGVYLPLPSGMHATWARRALLAGKHVLAEKPLATSGAEAAALAALAAERGLVLMENFAFLHHIQHRTVRAQLAAGAIGALRSVHAVFTIPGLPDEDIRWRPELGGGALLDTGVYPLRAAQEFLGPGLRVVGATLRHDPIRRVDVGGAALVVDGAGVTAQIEFGFDGAYRAGYELRGDRGRIRVPRAFTAPPDLAPPVLVEDAHGERDLAVGADHQFLGLLDAFHAAVGGAGADKHGRAAVRQAELLDRVRRAALAPTSDERTDR